MVSLYGHPFDSHGHGHGSPPGQQLGYYAFVIWRKVKDEYDRRAQVRRQIL
jgi:hypothetical protein